MVVVEGGGGERDWKRSREREGETERWRSAVKKNDLHLETKKKTFLSLVLSLVECSSFLEKNREALASLSLLPSRASEIAEQALVLSLPLSRAMTSPVKVKREREKRRDAFRRR